MLQSGTRTLVSDRAAGPGTGTARGGADAGVSGGPGTVAWLNSARRMLSFGLVGASGAVLNLVVMGVALHVGMQYVIAAVVAAELSICSNALLQERYVFSDRCGVPGRLRRFLQAVTFNNAEALARLPVLVLLVELLRADPVLAQAATLGSAFLLRFWFMSSVVYRVVPAPGPAGPSAAGSATNPR